MGPFLAQIDPVIDHLNKILNFPELSCIGEFWSMADYQNIL